jgi:hypothetical protein
VQSWKAVTISLLALGLAAVLGIKNIVKGTWDMRTSLSSGAWRHVKAVILKIKLYRAVEVKS